MITARSITLRRGARRVLCDVTLELRPGELTVAVGPNGAGKSTLLKILAGSLAPSEGRVFYGGRNVATLSAASLARQRAVLSQSLSLSFPFTVREVAELALQDLALASRHAISAQALEDVGLNGFADRRFQHLSGGEQQRVHLARVLGQLALQPGPQFLFLDEPTSSLDVRHQVGVLATVRRRISPHFGAFVVLHDLNLAAAIADRVLILQDGCVMAHGAPGNVLQADLLSAVYGIAMIRSEHAGQAAIHPDASSLASATA